MVLQSAVFCIDNTECMRNGDYAPTRFFCQSESLHSIASDIITENRESKLSLLCLSGLQIVHSFISDANKIYDSALKQSLKGQIDILTGIKKAQMLIKKSNINQQKSKIVIFAGSYFDVDEIEFESLSNSLIMDEISLHIVTFGPENLKNVTKLSKLIEIIKQKNQSVDAILLEVPPGSDMKRQVQTSLIAQHNTAGDTFEFDYDTDPELAMALRMSLEEEQQRLRSLNPAESSTTASITGATGMAVDSSSQTQEMPVEMDVDEMTEEEQLALAVAMSIDKSTAAQPETETAQPFSSSQPSQTDSSSSQNDPKRSDGSGSHPSDQSDEKRNSGAPPTA